MRRKEFRHGLVLIVICFSLLAWQRSVPAQGTRDEGIQHRSTLLGKVPRLDVGLPCELVGIVTNPPIALAEEVPIQVTVRATNLATGEVLGEIPGWVHKPPDELDGLNTLGTICVSCLDTDGHFVHALFRIPWKVAAREVTTRKMCLDGESEWLTVEAPQLVVITESWDGRWIQYWFEAVEGETLDWLVLPGRLTMISSEGSLSFGRN